MKIGDKFKSVTSGDVFTIIEINEKFRQIIVENQDGETKAYSSSTVKDRRRFVPVDDDSDYVKEVMQQKKDLGIECPPINPEEVTIEEITCAAPRLVPMPGVEKLAELKKEYPRKKQKTPCEGIGVDVKDFIIKTAESMNAEICVAASGKFISFKINGKMFAAIFSFSKKAATLGARSAAVNDLTPDKVMNHMMDYRFTFDDLSDENKNMISDILRLSRDYQLNKNK